MKFSFNFLCLPHPDIGCRVHTPSPCHLSGSASASECAPLVKNFSFLIFPTLSSTIAGFSSGHKVPLVLGRTAFSRFSSGCVSKSRLCKFTWFLCALRAVVQQHIFMHLSLDRFSAFAPTACTAMLLARLARRCRLP